MTKKKKIKLGAVALIVVLIFMFVWILEQSANKPSNGFVKEPNSTSKQSANIKYSQVSFTSPYVSFNYPSELKQNKPTAVNSPVVADYVFTYKNIYPWNYAVTIYQLPGGNINDNGDYRLRKFYPNIYQNSQVVINGTNVDVMTQTNMSGFYKVAFLINGNYQASVSLSSDNPNPIPLQQAFLHILDSWHWN